MRSRTRPVRPAEHRRTRDTHRPELVPAASDNNGWFALMDPPHGNASSSIDATWWIRVSHEFIRLHLGILLSRCRNRWLSPQCARRQGLRGTSLPASSSDPQILRNTKGPGLDNKSPVNSLTVQHRIHRRRLPNVSQLTQEQRRSGTRKEQQ